MNNNIRSSLRALVGGYLIYLSYQLFRGMRSGESDLPLWVSIAAIALFLTSGIVIIIHELIEWRRSRNAGDGEETGSDESETKIDNDLKS